MIQSAVTISLVPEAAGGPFVFWDGLEAGCAEAARLGFHAVEVFPPSAEALDAREVRRALQNHGLKLAAVGTGAGWVLHRWHLAHPDAVIRRRARQYTEAIIDWAGAFGVPAILGSMQGRAESGVSRGQALSWLREALEQLGPRAHGYGVPLLLEPLNRYETNLINTVDQALELIAPLRTRSVRLLCDLFHMNIEEADMAAALRQAGDHVGHVHFADSNRRAIGFGHTDMAPIVEALRAIGYQGYASAEVLPLPDSSSAARQTIEAYRRWFGAEAAPAQAGDQVASASSTSNSPINPNDHSSLH